MGRIPAEMHLYIYISVLPLLFGKAQIYIPALKHVLFSTQLSPLSLILLQQPTSHKISSQRCISRDESLIYSPSSQLHIQTLLLSLIGPCYYKSAVQWWSVTVFLLNVTLFRHDVSNINVFGCWHTRGVHVPHGFTHIFCQWQRRPRCVSDICLLCKRVFLTVHYLAVEAYINRSHTLWFVKHIQ